MRAPILRDPAPTASSLAADQKTFDEHLKAFLGDARYAQYQAYGETIDQRVVLNSWSSRPAAIIRSQSRRPRRCCPS